MTTIVGGLRARLLQDSLQAIVEDGLTQLGWFDPDRQHRPIVFLPEPQDWDKPIEFNSMVITSRSRTNAAAEVGSDFSRDRIRVTVDLYVESDSLAVALANDIRDLLRGRLGLGPIWGGFPILDLRLATPIPIGRALIDDVRATRVPPKVATPYTLYMFGVDVDVFDYYYSEGETP